MPGPLFQAMQAPPEWYASHPQMDRETADALYRKTPQAQAPAPSPTPVQQHSLYQTLTGLLGSEAGAATPSDPNVGKNLAGTATNFFNKMQGR